MKEVEEEWGRKGGRVKEEAEEGWERKGGSGGGERGRGEDGYR